LKYLAIGALCILSADFAQGASLKVTGAAGYASEWAIEGEATQAENTQRFAGPVTFTHAGLCTVGAGKTQSDQIRDIAIGILVQDSGNHFVRRGLVCVQRQALGHVLSWFHAMFSNRANPDYSYDQLIAEKKPRTAGGRGLASNCGV